MAAPRRKPTPARKRTATKPKPSSDPDPEVLPYDTEGFWQEFGPSDEHLLAGKSIVVLTLDRRTGAVEIDDALSTPAEAASMCMTASAKVNAMVDRLNGLYED
jgi:hypothetical protein